MNHFYIPYFYIHLYTPTYTYTYFQLHCYTCGKLGGTFVLPLYYLLFNFRYFSRARVGIFEELNKLRHHQLVGLLLDLGCIIFCTCLFGFWRRHQVGFAEFVSKLRWHVRLAKAAADHCANDLEGGAGLWRKTRESDWMRLMNYETQMLDIFFVVHEGAGITGYQNHSSSVLTFLSRESTITKLKSSQVKL